MRFLFVILLFLFRISPCFTQDTEKKDFAVIAYYAGRTTMIDSFEVEKLTHLIFSFCHLKGNRLSVNNERDSATILKMVELKKRNPGLKIILSLGGWGGCQTCSPVFATKKGRNQFARSVKALSKYFQTDGIDLDWEYPGIAGYPGHPYSADDKYNFSVLVKKLRKKLGRKKEISFAAGGFTTFIDSSLEWEKVMKNVDRVNLMSYDLVHGFSKITGHHTPLYSTPRQIESANYAIEKLIALGVPANKIVIGAAFYGRLFEVTDTLNNGLYQPGRFYHGFAFRYLADSINSSTGFERYWDTVAQASYAFNPQRKLLATYDDTLSVRLKTEYVLKKKLNGIMFWQLVDDKFSDGLLNVIDKIKKEHYY